MPKETTHRHWAVLIDNDSRMGPFVAQLLENRPVPGFASFLDKKGALFSKTVLERFLEEEDRHDHKVLSRNTSQALQTFSSGERKKALLRYILEGRPDFIILDNPFDNLDTVAQAELQSHLTEISDTVPLIFLISRKADLLPFVDGLAFLRKDTLEPLRREDWSQDPSAPSFQGKVPPPLEPMRFEGNPFISCQKVNVSYQEKHILKNIDWTINKGEFWELRGRNGSGKTTLLTMITGDNPKAYGQNLHIFGHKKGSGESVWELKRLIGYVTPAMTDKFTGYHSVEHMLISGLTDSIGLYIQPSSQQIRVAREWLELLGMSDKKDALFHNLTIGQKRLVLCARAMIKHPVLLILDEPTAGLDDGSAWLFTELVNKFAAESETTILFVSHRTEPGLRPDFIYQLSLSPEGSTGAVLHS